MQFQSRHFGNIAVATPAGRLDHAASVPFEQGLKPLWQDKQAAALIVDFSDVEYISSVGLRVLMIASKEMRKHGARIILASPQPTVTEILSISRFDRVLEIAPSVRKAVGWISQPALSAYEAGPGKSAKP